MTGGAGSTRISETEIRTMMADNPARLLGLD
jgi:hypothetical protein